MVVSLAERASDSACDCLGRLRRPFGVDFWRPAAEAGESLGLEEGRLEVPDMVAKFLIRLKEVVRR